MISDGQLETSCMEYEVKQATTYPLWMDSAEVNKEGHQSMFNTIPNITNVHVMSSDIICPKLLHDILYTTI